MIAPNRAATNTNPPQTRTAFMKIGYARISTVDQSLSLQIDALKAAGCTKIFTDKGISGDCVRRPALDDALAALQTGDQFITWKLDRLGRSLAHLIQLIGTLGERGVGFRSLSEAIDTTTAGGRLYFHMMGALAEFERSLIRERTLAGMAAARRRGATIGRPPKLDKAQIHFAMDELTTGKTNLPTLAEKLDVAPITLSRAIKREKNQDQELQIDALV